MTDLPRTVRRLISEVLADGSIELCIEETALPALDAGQVPVHVKAAPLHPSDLGMLVMPVGVSAVHGVVMRQLDACACRYRMLAAP